MGNNDSIFKKDYKTLLLVNILKRTDENFETMIRCMNELRSIKEDLKKLKESD